MRGALGHGRTMRKTVLLAAPLACALASLSGCVTVAPSQREMNPESAALEESFHSHFEAAREGGFGGHGVAGGGCGCG